ncbi:MAG: hypothetical protein J5913_02890, partial [Prevotella sp.]|nr:hypothetical protein [Prevotella sp.]
DGTEAGANLYLSITNNGSEVRTGGVTTVADGDDVVVKFVVAFPAGTAGTTIAANDGATLTFDYKPAISFGHTSDTTLEANHIYIVTKTIGSSSSTSGDMGNAPAGCQLVDLGLSVKWANMNIGATSEGDYGRYDGFTVRPVQGEDE